MFVSGIEANQMKTNTRVVVMVGALLGVVFVSPDEIRLVRCDAAGTFGIGRGPHGTRPVDFTR